MFVKKLHNNIGALKYPAKVQNRSISRFLSVWHDKITLLAAALSGMQGR